MSLQLGVVEAVRTHMTRLSRIRDRGAGVLFKQDVVAVLECPFLAARLAVDMAMREGQVTALFVTEKVHAHKNPALHREIVALTQGNRFELHQGREPGGFYAWRFRYITLQEHESRSPRFAGMPTLAEVEASSERALDRAYHARVQFGEFEPDWNEGNPF